MEKILNAAQYLFEEYKKLAGETIVTTRAN